MAERWAVATGSWSNTATWNGGTLPGSDDDVYSNNFTVTVDQNVTVQSLNNGPGTTPVAGGTFTVTSANITINATINGYGNTIGCVYYNTGGSNLTINGDINAGSQTNGTGVRCNVGATVTINATNINGGSGTTAYAVSAPTTNANIVINGATITGGSSSVACRSSASTTWTLNNCVLIAGSGAAAMETAHAAIQVSGSGTTARGNAWPASGTKQVAINISTAFTTGFFKIDTVECGANGNWPISGNVLFNNLSTATVKVRDSSLIEATLDAQTPSMTLAGPGGLAG